MWDTRVRNPMHLRLHSLVLLVLACFLFLTGACGEREEPDLSAAFESVDLRLADKQYLFQHLEHATSSIRLTLRSITDQGLILRLNDALQRGVSVSVVVDADFLSSANGLYTNAGLRYGNLYGNCDANFVIVDASSAVFLSSSDLTQQNLLYVTIRDRDLIPILEGEFNQMFAYDRYGGGGDAEQEKLEINHQTSFTVGQSTVEMYFLPQNEHLTWILENHILQSRRNLWAAFSGFDNGPLYGNLYDAIKGGLTTDFRIGQAGVSTVSNYMYLFNGTDTRVLQSTPAYNIVFLDYGTPFSRLVFTSYGMQSQTQLDQCDGVCLVISGPIADSLHNSISSLLDNQAVAPGFGNITFQQPDYNDIVFSEINWMGVRDNGGTSEPEGEFLELKNVSSGYVDISAFRIMITNSSGTPRSYSIPRATVLAPGGFFVVAKNDDYYSYYDTLWSDLTLYNTGFTVTLVDNNGTRIDHAGDVSTTLAGQDGTPRRTMIRNLSPVGDGTQSGSWSDAGTRTNILAEYYDNTYANPGADD